MVYRGRREHRRIRTSPADDHVRTLAQQFDERVDARHRDNAFGGVELGLGQVRETVESGDGVAERIFARRYSLSTSE